MSMINRLQFDYVNHRGEEHTYLVTPTTLTFTELPWEGKESYFGWGLNASVHERDGEARMNIRTFLISKMQNIQEVPASGT